MFFGACRILIARMPVTQLSDEDVIALVRKEFERKLKDFCSAHGYDDPGNPEEKPEEEAEEDDNDGDNSGDRVGDKPQKPENIEAEDLAPGIRVKHKDSQLVYTVISLNLGSGQVELETPEGTRFAVPAEELEKEYGLD